MYRVCSLREFASLKEVDFFLRYFIFHSRIQIVYSVHKLQP